MVHVASRAVSTTPVARRASSACGASAILPEDALANVTETEVLVVRAHSRRQYCCHPRLIDRMQRRIAVQTQREWPGAARQVKASKDLAQLLCRSHSMHIAAVRDAPPLEQFTIARQHYAVFGAANALDFVV